MTGARPTLFVCTFVLGLASLPGLWQQNGQGSKPTEELEAPDGYPCDDEFCFMQSRAAGTWHLEYHFKDLHEQWRTVNCDVKEADYGVSSYGYSGPQREASMAKELERAINTGLHSSPYRFKFGRVHVESTVEWRPAWKLRSLEEEQLFESERELFSAWYNQHKKDLNDQAKTQFLQGHGFMTVPALGEIPDYPALVAKSVKALNGCIAAFDKAAGDQPHLVQRFFQSMFFREIPLQHGDWKTGGLLLPITVMIYGIGDCDSKAAAFCALQSKQPPSLVIFRSIPGLGSPKHALVGVEAWKKDGSHPREKWLYKEPPDALRAMVYGDPIRVGLRDYWPCEVAGREWTDFGQVADQHAGHYMAIRIR
jgi:hypothetical protein